jgi:hypothetical protein
MAGAILRINGRPVSRGKVRVSLLLDNEVVAYFKAQSGEEDYSNLVNEALKANIRNHDLETLLRRVLREELQTAGS